MAKLPPKNEEDHSGEWLNTYADMVTLLLTFFVLLFACSNMDETKVQYIFQAFQIRGRYVNTVVAKPDTTIEEDGTGNASTPSDKGGEGDMPQSFDELYTYLSDYVDSQDLGDMVSLENGASQITIRFESGVLFDGDSYRLKAEARTVLSGIVPALRATNPLIQNVMVTGHTAYVPNPTMSVFMLSSMRAVSVEEFLALNKAVDESKYVCIGFGPNKPIADNDTADGKRKNRRVEIVIQKNLEDLDLNDPEVIQDMLEHDYNLPSGKYNLFGTPEVPPETLPEGSAEKIMDAWDKIYSGAGVSTNIYGPGSVDLNAFKIGTEESADGGSSGGTD